MAWTSSADRLDRLRLDATLFSQLAYQTPEYVDAAWGAAHGGPAELPPFLTTGVFQTREVRLDARLVALLKDVHERPTYGEDVASGANMFVFGWRLPGDDGGELPVLVCAVRGTSSWDDMCCDADMSLVSMDLDTHKDMDMDDVEPRQTASGVCVHSGFLRQLSALRPLLDTKVLPFEGDVLFVGHSLGAGMSAIAALRYSLRKPCGTVAWVGLGCPRVGNDAWRTAFDSSVMVRSRVVNGRDPVPKMPLECSGYRHVGVLQHVGETDHASGVPNMFDVAFHVLTQYVHVLSDAIIQDNEDSKQDVSDLKNNVKDNDDDDATLPPSGRLSYMGWFAMGFMQDVCVTASYLLSLGRWFLRTSPLSHV